MKTKKYILFTLLFCGILFSCGNPQTDDSKDLKQDSLKQDVMDSIHNEEQEEIEELKQKNVDE